MGVPYFGVLIIRILDLGYHIRLPCFRNQGQCLWFVAVKPDKGFRFMASPKGPKDTIIR